MEKEVNNQARGEAGVRNGGRKEKADPRSNPKSATDYCDYCGIERNRQACSFNREDCKLGREESRSYLA